MKPGKTTSSDRSQVINMEGMVHAPENEQGVVLLFAKLHRKLGFPTIDVIKTGFPDCWAIHRTATGSKRTWIEFEFKSSSFRTHLKQLKRIKPKRGYVVCWEHNWPGCDKFAEVIDLRHQANVGRRVFLQSTKPEFQAGLDGTPKSQKKRQIWTVAHRAKPGDILLMWRAGTHSEARRRDVDPGLLQSFANVFEVTSFPKHDAKRGREAHVRQIALLENPLYLDKIKSDPVLRNAPWVRASMQGRPDITSYWWRLHHLLLELNPKLRRDKKFARLDPSRLM
jgi:hypothetical protein